MSNPDRVSTLLESNLSLLHQIHELKCESRQFERDLRQSQVALAKLASGYRPGSEGWAEEDQQALDVAMGERS